MLNELNYAELGSGSFRNGEQLKVSENSKLGRSLLVTGFPYDINDNPSNALGLFTEIVKVSQGIRRLGSAAIDFCYVAGGSFEGFWEVHLHPWDICAGKLIVEEAGGIITDFDGNPASIHSKQILCTNKLIHHQLLEVIKKNKFD